MHINSMKTMIMIMCVISTLFSYNPPTIVQYVSENPLVDKCAIVQVDDDVVIACVTKPIFKRSDYLAFEKMLKEQLKKQFEIDEVFLTYDLKIYYNLSCLDEKDEFFRQEYALDLLRTMRAKSS